ncbi:hypothetical protein EYF80_050912 [Liparis tanakae]|uniref:Uncharacterized protein n=1 Tax=Liparis tanakae TaxID=230148 RepID=A0A4Z2FDR8_9TELE|nr:hypothetical protein EYF80_050912 [Liparis tanakae]
MGLVTRDYCIPLSYKYISSLSLTSLICRGGVASLRPLADNGELETDSRTVGRIIVSPTHEQSLERSPDNDIARPGYG